jgi:hypothetical protein
MSLKDMNDVDKLCLWLYVESEIDEHLYMEKNVSYQSFYRCRMIKFIKKRERNEVKLSDMDR